MSRASPELDLINAVPTAARTAGQQVDALVNAIAELPDQDPTSFAALRLWAAALPRLTECDIAIVAASLQLTDWWDQNTPDPTRVFGRPVAEQLGRAVQKLNRDQLEHAYAYCQELAARRRRESPSWPTTRTPRRAGRRSQNGRAPGRPHSARYSAQPRTSRSTSTIAPSASISERSKPPPAPHRRSFEVRITSQVQMPNGGVVTTDDRVIPPPPPARRRRWPRRNRSQR